ncbi:MAG: SufE family protein [Gammaproteobacteria bacterium]|nr:SufE family protein [Gammaproteobacteria bacterium]MCW9030993.1 SufE family protein [Gammaproteobacteria bacterium]
MTELDDIHDEFELLGDWEQRYQYLVELGEQLPPMPEKYKTDNNKVKGCMSQVWLQAYRNEVDSDLIRFYGDCDTTIIKGVLAVLIKLLSDKTLIEIEKLDVADFFMQLNLDENLSPNRHVGVYAIVELMKQQARNLQLTLT